MSPREALAVIFVIATGLAWGETATTDAEKSSGKGPGSLPRVESFSFLSTDYFARFNRDPRATPGPEEIGIDRTWRIGLPADADPLTMRMAQDLAQFLFERMGLDLPVAPLTQSALEETERTLVLSCSGGGRPDVPESFTITIESHPGRIRVQGRDPQGVRDGVVKLVDLMGFRQAPILRVGQQTYSPRLPLRVGKATNGGSYRDLAFMGYNAALLYDASNLAGLDVYAVSTSDLIPELSHRRDPELLARMEQAAGEARRYGIKRYCFLRKFDLLPQDHPLFTNHPGSRGAEVYRDWYTGPTGYIPCTEDPLVRQYLCESVRGVVQALDLDGVVMIVGGEEFQHCFMRACGASKGHTNCDRCEALGAEAVVSNLCNYLANAAREANPAAQIVVWPYSAEHVWSADFEQLDFISKLSAGTAILTEIEKSEEVRKADGVTKSIWDYSIDFIGPSQRARRQIEACRKHGIPIYLKSEPELAFEAPGLPYIPCIDRWAERAEVLAASGADGAWVFPFFRRGYGTTSAEVHKFFWWEPAPGNEMVIQNLARRIAGEKAAPSLRKAWRQVSDAIAWSPELPPYYTGPYYFGPAHYMFANPDGEPPKIRAYTGDPAFYRSPRGERPVFAKYYRQMEASLERAAREVKRASRHVPERNRATFDAEASCIQWFYHVARTHANFYESCELRDRLIGLAAQETRTRKDLIVAQRIYARWRTVLLDERSNANQALPVMDSDTRLEFEFYEKGAGPVSGSELIRLKIEVLDRELTEFLPDLVMRCGIAARSANRRR